MRAHIEADVVRLAAVASAAGLGLLTVAVADTIARDGSKWAEPLFWAGMLMLWVPSTARIVGRKATRSERIALLVLLGMGMYVVSLLYSPRYFVVYDEFLHWRTAQDMLRTGRIFNANPGLPVSPLYPGLEIVTSEITKLTGLSVLVGGRIVVGMARLLMILALYLLYERVGRSSWLASVATVIYFTNPEFLFFDGIYAYESLGISLAVLVLYAVARGRGARGRDVVGTTLLVVLPLVAMAVTHHTTSFILVLALILLATFALFFDTVDSRWWLWGVALAGAGFVLLWLYLVAGPVISYLRPTVGGGVSAVIKLIRGDGAPRHLFQSSGMPPTPRLDEVGAFVFAAITILVLPLGGLQIWRARRFDTFILAFALGAVAYPLSGLFHFTTAGAELGQRLDNVVFVPVAFCMAMAVAAMRRRATSTVATATLVMVSAVLLYGGATTGSEAWLRLPGRYLVSANKRSIEAQGIAAASWAGQFLPHGSRVGVDRINQVLMLTYGRQWPVTSLGDGIDLAPVFLDRQLTRYDLDLLRSASVRYLIVDHRLTRAVPVEGFYYEEDEPGAGAHTKPVPAAALAKFDWAMGASRVFDSGDIAIFDVRKLVRDG